MNAGLATPPNMPVMPPAKIQARLADPPAAARATATIRFSAATMVWMPRATAPLPSWRAGPGLKPAQSWW